MKNQLLQMVLEFCQTYELHTEQTNSGDYVWVYCNNPEKISAFLQAFLVLRFPSICFDRHMYNKNAIICAMFNDFGICVTLESEV